MKISLIGTFDPNYQTLAGIGGEVFGADKKAAGGGGGGGAIRAPEKGGMAGEFTLSFEKIRTVL